MSRPEIQHTPDELPIACSLEPRSADARILRWQALADRALLASQRDGGAARQRYRDDAGVDTELEDLIALERQCCPFLDFNLDRADGELVLDVTGPVEADSIIEAFARGTDP